MKIEKQLLYDRHTLEDNYEYRKVERSFQWDKIAEIVYGTPIYITTDERKQLAEADMGDDKQLETQRDIFVLSINLYIFATYICG